MTLISPQEGDEFVNKSNRLQEIETQIEILSNKQSITQDESSKLERYKIEHIQISEWFRKTRK